MELIDLHIHALPGVDDGAKTDLISDELIRKDYTDGVRTICFTPHYHPGFFSDNRKSRDDAFAKTLERCRLQYPDLQLLLGNELRYSPEAVSWLKSGDCLTLNKTRNVLIDFDELEEDSVIMQGLFGLLSNGYRPVLAHAERYFRLHKDLREIESLCQRGVTIQVDTQSVLGDFGWRAKHIAHALIKNNMAYLIGSDAHDCNSRPPKMRECYDYVRKKFGEHCAHQLFYDNAVEILGLKKEGKNGTRTE